MKSNLAINLCRLILAALIFAFVGGFVWAGGKANILASLQSMLADPWGAVTFLDLYTGLLFVAVWIFWIERSVLVALIWLVALAGLGNFATVCYLFMRSLRVSSPAEILMPRESINGAFTP